MSQRPTWLTASDRKNWSDSHTKDIFRTTVEANLNPVPPEVPHSHRQTMGKQTARSTCSRQVWLAHHRPVTTISQLSHLVSGRDSWSTYHNIEKKRKIVGECFCCFLQNENNDVISRMVPDVLPIAAVIMMNSGDSLFSSYIRDLNRGQTLIYQSMSLVVVYCIIYIKLF